MKTSSRLKPVGTIYAGSVLGALTLALLGISFLPQVKAAPQPQQGWAYVGFDAKEAKTYSGTQTILGTMALGVRGNATVSMQKDAIIDIAGQLNAGVGSLATITADKTTIKTGGAAVIGVFGPSTSAWGYTGGQGVLVMNNGSSLNVGGDVSLGQAMGTSGKLILNDSVANVGGRLLIGYGKEPVLDGGDIATSAPGMGSVAVNGGKLKVAGDTHIGVQKNGQGSLTLAQGGSAVLAGNLVVSDQGRGSVSVERNSQLDVKTAYLSAGTGAQASLLDVAGNFVAEQMVVGDKAVVRSSGSIYLTGAATSAQGDAIAALTVNSGAKISGTVQFTANTKVLLQAGSGSTVLRGVLNKGGVSQIDVTGGNFTLGGGYGSRGELSSVNIKGGEVILGSFNAKDSFNVTGGNVKLLFNGFAVSNGNTLVNTQATDYASVKTGETLGNTIIFDMTDKALDYIGKTVGLVTVNGVAQQWQNVKVQGHDGLIGVQAPGSWTKYDDGVVSFQYRFDGSNITVGSAVSEIVVKEDQGSHVRTEIVKESEQANFAVNEGTGQATITIEKGGITEVVGIGSNMNVRATEGSVIATQDEVRQITHTDEIKSKEEVISKGDVSLIVRDNAEFSSSNGQAPAEVGNTPEGKVDNVIITSDSALKVSNTNIHAGKKLTTAEGSSLSLLKGSTVFIGGGQITEKPIGAESVLGVTGSSISGSLKIEGGSKLVINPVTVAGSGEKLETKLVINAADIDLGTSDQDDNGSIEAQNGAIVDIVNSILKGSGALKNVSLSNSHLTAGHSPGVLVLDNVKGDANSVSSLSAHITKNAQSGVLNTDTTAETGAISQFKVIGAFSGNYIFNVLDNDGIAETLGSGTQFKFLDLAAATDLSDLNINPATAELPTLADGLVWDFSDFKKTGITTIQYGDLADGVRVANALWSSTRTVSNFGLGAAAHLDDYRAGKTNIWVGGLGDFASSNDRNGVSGYDYSGAGYSVGADYATSKNTITGIAFGQSWGENTSNNGTLRADAGNIKQYADMISLYNRVDTGAKVWGDSPILIDSYVGYGNVENKSTKHTTYDGRQATAKWDDTNFVAGVKAMLVKKIDNTSVFKPFIALDYLHGSQGDFTESTAVTSAHYADGNMQQWTGSLGATYARTYVPCKCVTLTPEITAAYVFDFSRDTPQVNVRNIGSSSDSAAFGVVPGRHAIQATAALNAQFSKNWAARCAYDVEARSGKVDQSVGASVNYSF